VFNLRDDFLNDMTKIDKDFFTDYYKINMNEIDVKDMNKSLSNIADLKKNELIYDFAIYHPLKNVKTQQISILGSCHLNELKDKIYCVLDEIYCKYILNQPMNRKCHFSLSKTVFIMILDVRIVNIFPSNFLLNQ